MRDRAREAGKTAMRGVLMPAFAAFERHREWRPSGTFELHHARQIWQLEPADFHRCRDVGSGAVDICGM